MFTKAEVALGLVFLATCAGVQPTNAQQSAADVLIQRARTLDGQGRHDLAAAAWRQVLLLNPSQPDALAGLASFYQSNGDTATANRYLAQLRSVKPGDARITKMPAQVGATSDFEAAAKLAAQHRYEEALALYRKAFHGTEPSGMWALSYYETEAAVPAELPQAIAGLRGLAKKYPANPAYQLALGRVLTYDPKTRLEGARLLASIRGTADQTEQARRAWRQAILWTPNGPVAETAQEYLSRYPDDQLAARLHGVQAEHAGQASTEGQPEQGEAYAALRKGDLQQAKQLFQPLLSIPAQRGKALAGLGYVNMQQQDFAAAIEHFEQAQSAGFRTPELSAALVDAHYWKAMQDGNRALDKDELSLAMSAFGEAHSVKPASPEALEGQAGVWMQQNLPDRALPLLEQAVKMQQDRPQGWVAWFDALVQSGRSKEVIADQPYIAPETLSRLESDPDYIAIMAAAQTNVGNEAEARRLVDQLAQNPQVDKRSAAQLHCAELLARGENPRASARLAFEVIRVEPDNVDAWKLLVRDEHLANRDQMALTAVDRMPAAAYQQAIRDVDFVTMLAATYQDLKQYSTASNLLAQARSETRGDAKKSGAVEAQTASLLLAEGDAANAYKAYMRILNRYPQNTEAWNGAISALHQANQDQDAFAQFQQLPSDVAERLEEDPGFLQIMASVYEGTRHNRLAVETMGRVLTHYKPGSNEAPYAVEAQYAWLLLNTGDESRLASTLTQMGRRTDLTGGEQQQTRNIWAAWSIRKAAREEKNGNSRQALAILETAFQAYPANADIRRALAGMYIRNNEGKLAYALYQQVDWARATATDYAGAIAAASAAHQNDAGRQWLANGLEQWPADPQLLTAAAQFEQAIGETHKAEFYWRKVAANKSEIKLTQQLTAPNGSDSTSTPTANDALAHMLAPPDAAASQTASSTVVRSEPLQDAITALPIIQHPQSEANTDSKDQATPWLMRKSSSPAPQTQPIAYQPHGTKSPTSRWAVPASNPAPSSIPAESEQQDSLSSPGFDPHADETYSSPVVTNASLTIHPAADGGAEFASADAVGSPAAATAPETHPLMRGAAEQAQTELEGLAGRYSAWIGGGTQFGNRSGQAGFDQLTRLEGSVESSAVLGESARLTVRALPVMLSAGAPDGTSKYNFGTSGVAPIGQAHFQSGIGGELQLSTRFLDGKLGFTPRSFPVSHALGSVTLHPPNFPLSFRVYRDQVKETMLSYAGEQDPVTGLIWGGVVATGAEGGLSLGTAKSGLYVDGGAASLTGVNVTRNNRIYGSAGTYWTIYTNPYGALKMGANMTGLHYGQNQRYFTFGQGGYFSPDSYLLLNTPFTWEGRPVNHFVYRIGGSLGVQSFYEGTAISGSTSGPAPTAQSNIGANYNLDANLAYRFDQHWYLGGFLGVNNAHDYQDRTAGFAVKYMQRPQVDVEGGPTGLFDEHAIRPLIVP
jgi:tetratricopeptide (TPR) repeat protein